MLRCLILFRSAAINSSRPIILPSMTLATIRTYGRMREFTRVGSSRSRPSNGNATFSDGEASPRTSRDADSLADSTPEEFTLGAPEGSVGVGCPRRVGGAWTSHGESPLDRLRLPLRRFFALLPASVR